MHPDKHRTAVGPFVNNSHAYENAITLASIAPAHGKLFYTLSGENVRNFMRKWFEFFFIKNEFSFRFTGRIKMILPFAISDKYGDINIMK